VTISKFDPCPPRTYVAPPQTWASEATLRQLKELGSFAYTLMTIWRTLRHFGLTFKEKVLHLSERGQPKVQAKRRRYRRKVRRIEAKRLQFLDETGVHTAMMRTGTWAPRGERAARRPHRGVQRL